MKLISFDTETHLIQPGLALPPLVCGSIADGKETRLLSKEETDVWFREAIQDKSVQLGGTNFVYDLGIMAARDPSLLDVIFDAVEGGRTASTDILEALDDSARGCMLLDPVTRQGIGRYSQALLENRYLGIDRSAQKENGWRFKYALLENTPLAQWPQEAIEYPRQDAEYGFRLLSLQLSEGRENLQCLTQEMKAAWFLRLASAWGMRTDPSMVPGVVGGIRAKHEQSRREFFKHGIVRVRPCNKKDGEFESSDDIDATALTELEQCLDGTEEWHARRIEDIKKCREALAKGRPIRYAEDKGRLKELVSAAYRGDPPMTAGGETRGPAISTNRDTLDESGDEVLEEYAEAGPNEKLFTSFCSVLEQGMSVPINPSGNSIVSTQRTSYREPNLQQLPRKGGIRECFVPRGYVIQDGIRRRAPEGAWVYCSVDYGALELCTLAQVCVWLFGKSAIADAINAGQDLHCRLAGRFLGISYDEAVARKKAKDPLLVDLRQAAKPVNFGLPGMMGPPKLVYTARKDGVRFCELAGRTPKGCCGKNPKVLEWARRKILPTCEVCLDLAIAFKRLWYEEWPEMVDYHKVTAAQTEECDEGVPLESFGTGMKRLDTNVNAVSNHFFQNLAAQGAKHAGWLLAKESYNDRKSVLFNNFRTVVFVHDETIAEIREGVMHEAAMRHAEIMRIGMQEFVKDVKITAEPALCRRWFKGADKELKKDGSLKPWWPGGWSWAPDQELMREDLAA